MMIEPKGAFARLIISQTLVVLMPCGASIPATAATTRSRVSVGRGLMNLPFL